MYQLIGNVITTVFHIRFSFPFQYLFGFLSFLWPKLPDDNRAQYLNVHQFFGSAIFVLAIGACLTGITEKLLFSM